MVNLFLAFAFFSVNLFAFIEASTSNIFFSKTKTKSNTVVGGISNEPVLFALFHYVVPYKQTHGVISLVPVRLSTKRFIRNLKLASMDTNRGNTHNLLEVSIME